MRLFTNRDPWPVQRPFFLALSLCVLTPLFAKAQPVTQPFTFSLKQQNLPAVRNASTTWADIDNDGDLDALVSGRTATGLTGGLFRNDGSDGENVVFTRLSSTIRALAFGRAAWADVDGDGDMDVALSGSATATAPYAPVIVLYRNDGGAFVELDAGLPALHSGALAWADTDNDGDLDLLATGVDVDGVYRSVLARNSGGTFSLVDAGIPGFAFGEARWGDYDQDGDVDLLISGATAEGFRSRIYANNAGTLTDSGVSFAPVAFSSVDWGDYDQDGDLDVVVGGGQVTPRIFEGKAEIYRNDGGTFTAVGAGITGTLAGSITWGDYDNDGDLDLLSLGAESALGRRTARIFRNLGDGTFSNATLLVGAIFAAADWGDFDGDGDLDLLASGATSYGENILNLYVNERQVVPPPLASPASLTAREEAGTVVLTWSDPQPGPTTYDIRIGTRPGASDVRAVAADPASGLRRLGRPGAHTGVSTYLTGLAPGTYYWSVQSVGPSFGASPFSEEASFVVSFTGTDVAVTDDLPTEFALNGAYPNPFAGAVTVQFDVPAAAGVRIRVLDVLGREAAVIFDQTATPGTHRTIWTPSGRIAGGLYFIELSTAGRRLTRSVTLLR